MMRLSQEKIVLVIWLALFVVCSIALEGFFQPGNLLSLLRSVAVLGMLAIGMSVVIIGRGIDLSMIATMAVSVALCFGAISSGYSLPLAILFGLSFALACGLLTGFLIAYHETEKNTYGRGAGNYANGGWDGIRRRPRGSKSCGLSQIL